MDRTAGLSRRRVLASGVGGALAAAGIGAAEAAGPPFAEALRAATGGREPQPGRVRVEIPQITENGNSVPLSVSVESPMSEADHVRTIYVFAQKNPYPEVARFHLGPRAGRAQVSTTIRLAATQRVLALAAMSDGSLWSGEGEVLVTMSACIDGG